MNKKIIIQSILFFIIILFIGLFIFKFLVETEAKNNKAKKIELSTDTNKNFSNIIENIEYKSNDNRGNQYIIKAKYGEIVNENSNLLLMSDVEAIIIFSDYEKVTITSSGAIYNIINYDTNFKENITIKYAEHNMTSNNADLLFKDHRVKIYNDINYNNLNTDFFADVMEIDLLTKKLKIYMNSQNKKIKATYKNNGNN
jgi:hypothetical protein|tara:strand:+ start:728 stop:1324 length:597 start_codon:yes stop_codon:yes gene_type:complete